MTLSATERRQIRNILAKHYPTFADAQRVAEDIELPIDINQNASIGTIWNSILKLAEQEASLKLLFEIVAEEGIEIAKQNNRSIQFEEDETATPAPHLLFKNHLFLIGIDKYQNGISTLNNAVSDIEAFKKIALERYQFTTTNCIELTDGQATRANIIAAFRKLQSTLTAEDNLLFYFSGHGELDKITQMGYWIPADAKQGDYSSYLSNQEIRHYIQALKTQHTFGIVDACFSGSMFMKSSLEVLKRYYNIPSRWLMTSGLEEPVPDGLPGHHSPFSASLLTQLKNNFQPALSTNDLWGRMREGVIANSAQTPRCEPIQSSGHQGGEFFFLLKDAEISQIPTTEKIDANTPLRQLATTGVNSLQVQLRQLVAADELDEAFNVLNDKLAESSSHKMLVYGRMGGYNGLKKRINQGILSEEHARIQMAQIRQALLYVVDEMEEADLR